MSDGIYSIANGLLRSGQNNEAVYVGVQPELEYTSKSHLDLKGIFVYFRAGELLNKLLMDPASITLEPCLNFVSKII